MTDWLDQLKWNEAGLVPAIAQDADTGGNLMVAWMNRQALQETVETKRAVYFSRSRQKLWRKGEENARKIALILAASESFDSPYITASIADYSCRLVQYLLLSFGKEILPTIVSGQIESQKQKLLEIIKKTGIEGCPTRDITRAARWSNKRQRDALLADLVEAQEIIAQPRKGGVYFWTVENYRSYLEQQEKESKK